MVLSFKKTTFIQTVHLALHVGGRKPMRGRVHVGDKGKDLCEQQGWCAAGLGQYWMQTWLAVWWPALPRDGVDNGSGRLVNTRRGTGGYVSMSSNEFFK